MKEKMFKEIVRLIEIIAKKKRWDCYEILELMVILDDNGKFAEANITVFYSDENGFDEVLKSKFRKITRKNILSNAKIY